jgi:hypothetical protein
VSAAEAVGVEDFTTTEDVASAVAVVSSRASPSSSESLRTITLPSSSGPRRSQLRSPNSRQANSVSREVSTKKSSSSEDEESSITGMFPEGPPCSNTSERGRHEEISDGDPDGGGDPNGAGGRVLASLGEGLPSAEGEHGRLVHLLSSIASKSRAGERNPK